MKQRDKGVISKVTAKNKKKKTITWSAGIHATMVSLKIVYVSAFTKKVKLNAVSCCHVIIPSEKNNFGHYRENVA